MSAPVERELLERFAANCERNGLTLHRGAVPQIEGATVSVAVYGLADPGSVCIACSPEEPRLRSLLPDDHVAVVFEDRILPDVAALFRELGGRMPSSLAIISGPSRSADIEQMLALGVHGPGRQHVVILPAGAEASLVGRSPGAQSPGTSPAV